jgi:hypothetical protein
MNALGRSEKVFSSLHVSLYPIFLSPIPHPGENRGRLVGFVKDNSSYIRLDELRKTSKECLSAISNSWRSNQHFWNIKQGFKPAYHKVWWN